MKSKYFDPIQLFSFYLTFFMLPTSSFTYSYRKIYYFNPLFTSSIINLTWLTTILDRFKSHKRYFVRLTTKNNPYKMSTPSKWGCSGEMKMAHFRRMINFQWLLLSGLFFLFRIIESKFSSSDYVDC